jgi:outer membrane immunogenic protein
MRARIRRLEAEKDNISLRERLQQLQEHRAGAAQHDPAASPARVAPPPAVATSSPVVEKRELVLADMDFKARPVLLPQYYSWTGFYFGGNIGYGVGNDRELSSLSEPGVGSVVGGTTAIAPVGAIGGVQLGYNWQGSPNWLVGFEADFQGSAQNGLSCAFTCINEPGIVMETFTAQHQLEYFGTFRGRVGFVNDSALFYVTGGGAYGRIEQTVAATANETGTATFATASSSENKFGFVVGGGIEAALGGNWTGKVEYLYMDLGTTGNSVSGVFLGAPVQPFTFGATSNIHDNIVRVGLNYRVGGQAQPAVSAYDSMAAISGPVAPVYSWTGFYTGANVGYGIGNDHVAQSLAAGGLTATTEPGSAVMPKGVLGGVQLGYNWQGGSHWLVGFEADFQGAAQTDTACAPLFCVAQSTTTSGLNGTEFVTVQHQLDYFGTIRGRLGGINNNVLYYVTGGAAFGHVTQTTDVNISLSSPGVFVNDSTNADMAGFVVGGGIEAAIGGGWTAKAEYLYMDLGSITDTANLFTGAGNPGEALATTSTIHDHIVRFGANYHFDIAQPVVARY